MPLPHIQPADHLEAGRAEPQKSKDVHLGHHHLLQSLLLSWCGVAADRFVLGLCDGNHCESGEAGRDRGNGRIVVAHFRQYSPPRNHCHWVPEKVISIPATAAFQSYAGLAIRGNQLLISSKVRAPSLNAWNLSIS